MIIVETHEDSRYLFAIIVSIMNIFDNLARYGYILSFDITKADIYALSFNFNTFQHVLRTAVYMISILK